MDDRDPFSASRTTDGRYKLLVDGIIDYAIYMLDPDGSVASWNLGAQRFKGYKADEIIGEHFSRFYTDEDRAAGLPAIALRTAQAEGRYESEGWRVRKDGSHFWAHVVIDPIRLPSGELAGFAKITRDLTERKAAEDTLRQSQEQFRILVQSVTDYAIFMLDPGGRVTNWNAGAQRIKGYSPEEIIGDHFSRFYTPEDREAGKPEAALRTAETEGRFDNEGWRVRKDGSRFWAHVVIDPIRDDQGAVIGFAKVTRDVTERKEAQAALDAARDALFQSQKMEAIGQLTGGIAHDFNNLLMAVQGSLEILQRRLPADPKVTALIENALSGAHRGAILTQRLLAFARRQELHTQAVDLPELVRDMTGLLMRVLGPSIQIDTRFPLGLPAVLTDANQLENALLNLAVNARDAMSGKGTITIEAQAEVVRQESAAGLAPGGYVRLSVSDNGVGMDANALARATEPFFTTKGVGKGTGLGLSMAQGLAEQSGGRLTIRSAPGVGTTVELWLPQARAVDERPVPVGIVPSLAPVDPIVILAVDDDSLVLMNTVAMLEDLGHRVVSALSAEEAMASLGEGTVDLVITDYAMPQTTGLQLAEAIRADHPRLPVIVATGYAELPPGVTCDLPRLSKPYSQHDLARAIRQVHDDHGFDKV